MTNANNANQEVYALLAELARKQLQTETNLQRTQEKIDRTQEQLERTEDQLQRTQQQLETTQQQLSATQYEVESLTNDVNRVLTRSVVLDEVVLELRDTQSILQMNQEIMQRNFEQHQNDFRENQRTTNAALNSLEAINLRLIQIITGDQN